MSQEGDVGGLVHRWLSAGVLPEHLPDASHASTALLEDPAEPDEQVGGHAVGIRAGRAQIGDGDAETGCKLGLGAHEELRGACEVEGHRREGESEGRTRNLHVVRLSAGARPPSAPRWHGRPCEDSGTSFVTIPEATLQ